MAEEFFEVKITPSVLKYLMLISTFAAGLVGIVSYYAAEQEGTATSDFLSFFAGMNFALMAVSALELMILRKKLSGRRVAIGGLVELFRASIYLDLPLLSIRNRMNDVGREQYDSYVGTNLGMQAVGALGLVTLIALLVANFGYDRLARLREKMMVRNAFNAIPAIVLIIAYAASMGVFREALIGPRHQDDIATPAYIWDESLFSQYSTIVPGWDASDLLQSYLNQFLAGLNNSQREILRYRDDTDYGNGGAADQVFLRAESYAKYVYDETTETSAFERADEIEETRDYATGQIFASAPSNLNNLDNFFLIKLNITYSGTQWTGYLPTTWDTQNYNYVFDSSTNYEPEVHESDGSIVDPSDYSIAFTEESTGGIPRGVKATITFDQAAQGYNSRYLYYYVPYNEMDAINFFDLALPPSAINDLPPSQYNLTEISKFLQMPNGNDRPDLTNADPSYEYSGTSYWEWANYSIEIANQEGGVPGASGPRSPRKWLYDYVVYPNNLDDEDTSAFYIAYTIANQIGSNFTFDWDMWKSEYTTALLGQYVNEGERLGPEDGEDYIGWMFNRGKLNASNGNPLPDNKWLGGTAAHFATSLCMMLREMGIPARTVVGYVGANEQSDVEAVVTALYTHSWVEAFIPMDYDLNGQADAAEWVMFDAGPRLNGFLPLLPDSGNSVKWTYDISLELLNATSGAPWTSDEVFMDETLNLNVTVFTTSETGEVKRKEKANVTIGFQEIGESGQLVGDYITLASNLITPANGEVSLDLTYNSTIISLVGAGLASLAAYVNNTVTGDPPGPYSPGTTINGWNFSKPLTWKPFPNPNPASSLRLENSQRNTGIALESPFSWDPRDEIAQVDPLMIEDKTILPIQPSQNANITDFVSKRRNSTS